jgi:hypothetical protein
MRNTGLLWNLTLLRFDLTRSFNLPVWQLERLRGSGRRNRQKVLQKRTRSSAVWLTFCCMHIEMLLLLSSVVIFLLFLPGSVEFDWKAVIAGEEYGFITGWLSDLSILLIMALVEPFYTGAGFSLYLNRRAHLEGWDLELVLRRMANRLKRERLTVDHAHALSGVLAVVLLFTCSMHPQPVYADEDPSVDLQQQHKEIIGEVVSHKDFNQYEEVSSWRYKGDKDKSDADSESISEVLALIAKAYEVILWALGIAVLYWLISNHLRWTKLFGDPDTMASSPQAKTADRLFGMDVRPSSLPDDIPGQARKLWQQADADGAMSLLYRGALASLINVHELALNSSATEGDCVQLVNERVPGSLPAYFSNLTDAWLITAYAHRYPHNPVFDSLCSGWTHYFQEKACQQPSNNI